MKYQYQYLVEPFDVLFFRNNKAFDFGDWYSEGFFPPLPSTFQGFVRTSILLLHKFLTNGKVKWRRAKNLIGDENEFPLDLRGPFLCATTAAQHFYFVTPRDLIKEKGKNGHCGRQIRLSENPISTDIGDLYFAAEAGKPRFLTFEQSFINSEEFNAYRTKGSFCIDSRDVVLSEEHYGIALKPDKQVEEHHFYVTPYQRLNQNVALYFQLKSNEKIKNLTHQYSRLGSEGRGAVIRDTDHGLSLKMSDSFYLELAREKKFKLIFLQPGILPDDFKLFKVRNGITVMNSVIIADSELQVLYAAMDGKLKISGVDYKNKSKNPSGHKSQNKENYQLKPMMNAIPAGSVFYFQILNNTNEDKTAEKLKELDDSKIGNSNYSRMGYNHIVLGKII